MGPILTALAAVMCFIFRKGIVQSIIWAISYFYLKLRRRFTRRRFDLYDFSSKEAEKTGFVIPRLEWTLESPQTADVQKKTDVAFCNGTNSSSEGLVIGLYRQGNGKVKISLVLRLANGCTYSMPSEHSLQTETDEPHTFGSSRVKMQCLLPMRKWRVFFNGLLRETSSNGEDNAERYRHVKFAFIWTASSDVYDYKDDASPKVQADIAAKFWTWKCSPLQLLRRLRKTADGYEQCGMLIGTVNIEGQPEKEVYLWGLRGRYMDLREEQKQYHSIDAFINSENGTFIRLGIFNAEGYIEDMPYGYVMRPNGFILPIESCTFLKKKDGHHNETNFVCAIEGEKFTVQLSDENLQPKFHGRFNELTSVNQYEGCLNSMPARGFILETDTKMESKPIEQSARHPETIHKRSLFFESIIPLSLPFDDSLCELLTVSGGKGSSLAKLNRISEELKTFTVPKGIVVTTSAYVTFTRDFLPHPLKKLEETVWKQDHDKTEVQSACAKVMEEIISAELPTPVEESVKKNLDVVFGKDAKNIRFAVRSSATGEDTEQMSAAGQMETFLGCRGISEVLSAVKKCWASQFSFIAVEYKRRYGQPLDTPMAVVIQEMVPCDAAGVAFTCDPVTGNPSYITITANYGLGESVVSASADPDTVTLERDIKDNLRVYSKTAGVKQTKIVMDEFEGTKEVSLDQETSSECSITDDTALNLGDVTIKIEMQFGSPRDIEWGVLGGKIFLFQARPVTTIDTETDFEAGHMFDTYLRREDEFLTTAHIGEAMPGAASPLGTDVLNGILELAFLRMNKAFGTFDNLPPVPYYPKRLIQVLNHWFFCMSEGFVNFGGDDPENISDQTKSMSIAIFGRVIDDKRLFQVSKDRHVSQKKSRGSIASVLYWMSYMFFGKYFIKRISKKVEKYRIPVKEHSSSMEIFRIITKNYQGTIEIHNGHSNCSSASVFWNMRLLSFLVQARGEWDHSVYRDFGYLQSSIKQVESADVPSSIQDLGDIISRCIEPETFKKMSVDEALRWLQSTSTEAGKRFKSFLEKHGHHCQRELDLGTPTWAMDPTSLVKTLQGLVSERTENFTQKKPDSFNDIVSNLEIPLNFFQRLRLRLLLPNCHRGIRQREESKTLIVRAHDTIRDAFTKLADALVREGRLPNRDLMFFLCVEEIRQLIETRSPTLVMRAFRRWKVQPQLEKLIFPEITSGIPRPMNMNEELDISGDGFSMTGIPVSHGVIKGVARVVIKIEDAPNIEHGDILIAHSTNVAWSPYFPMLSGVVTELGGLISHGAVVAREYGLPCIIGLQGATRAFKSGDFVLLDGNRGVLQKIEKL